MVMYQVAPISRGKSSSCFALKGVKGKLIQKRSMTKDNVTRHGGIQHDGKPQQVYLRHRSVFKQRSNSSQFFVTQTLDRRLKKFCSWTVLAMVLLLSATEVESSTTPTQRRKTNKPRTRPERGRPAPYYKRPTRHQTLPEERAAMHAKTTMIKVPTSRGEDVLRFHEDKKEKWDVLAILEWMEQFGEEYVKLEEQVKKCDAKIQEITNKGDLIREERRSMYHMKSEENPKEHPLKILILEPSLATLMYDERKEWIIQFLTTCRIRMGDKHSSSSKREFQKGAWHHMISDITWRSLNAPTHSIIKTCTLEEIKGLEISRDELKNQYTNIVLQIEQFTMKGYQCIYGKDAFCHKRDFKVLLGKLADKRFEIESIGNEIRESHIRYGGGCFYFLMNKWDPNAKDYVSGTRRRLYTATPIISESPLRPDWGSILFPLGIVAIVLFIFMKMMRKSRA